MRKHLLIGFAVAISFAVVINTIWLQSEAREYAYQQGVSTCEKKE